MLHPSYHDLIQAVNSGVEPGEEPVVQSRYSIVIAAAKRARQLIAGEDAMVPSAGRKPLSVAVDELYRQKVRIVSEDDTADDEPSAFAAEAVKADAEAADAADAAETGGDAADAETAEDAGSDRDLSEETE